MKIEITDVAHGGVFVGRVNNEVIFVRGALPGEVCDIEITKKRSKLSFARVTRVLEASEHRVKERWPDGAAGVVGAADFQHSDLAYQRELKGDVIRALAHRVGSSQLGEALNSLTVEPVDSTDGWHRRTRFDLVKLPQGVGMYKEQSHELVRLTEQPLAVAELEALDLYGSAWDDVIAAGTRMHVVAPASGPNVVVAGKDVWTASNLRTRAKLIERATTESEIFDYEVTPSGFWQVHAQAPSALLRLVLAGADVHEGDHVVELFSGAGLFSLPLAAAIGPTGRLVTMEGAPTAVADARANLAKFSNTTFHTGRIDVRHIRELTECADVVIADPPRSGLGTQQAKALAACGARRIVVVSCDPAAMARDAATLIAHGRELLLSRALDIFPQTHHVECVCVFGEASPQGAA
ncbi:class I SAM-dependent RNA methyltransferase [Arcanobacterium canis]